MVRQNFLITLAICGVLVVSAAFVSRAGQLNPPAGPIQPTTPSLQDVQTSVDNINVVLQNVQALVDNVDVALSMHIPATMTDLQDIKASNTDKTGLFSSAFRSVTLVLVQGSPQFVFTAPTGKPRFITGIHLCCAVGPLDILIDGVKVLQLKVDDNVAVFVSSWSSGGGAPIVVDAGQTVTIDSSLTVPGTLTITGYEF